MELTTTEIKLLQYLSDGQFYSGKQLALEFGVSRTTIWNYLKNLEKFGIDFHAVKGKGTRLAKPIELLNKQLILEGLSLESSKYISQLELLTSLPSTSKYLLQKNQSQKLNSGMVCIAEMQTSGKGRLGRAWVSPFAQNLYISFLWNFKTGIGALSGLSLACGIAVCHALKNIGLNGHALKWPNDILFEESKLAGILVEIQGESQDEYTAIVGIGINCNMTAQEANQIDQPWTDIKKAILGKPFSRNALASELIGQVLKVLSAFESEGLKPLLPEWNKYDACKDKNVKIIAGATSSLGVAKGVTELGELKLLNSVGEIEHITSGEVSLRLE